jgi:acyl dehydratase
VADGLGSIDSYEVVAHNPATLSANKIHDDEVARRYGFAGGLVPGVDVYAYLTHIPAREWGLDWLAHGTIDARFGSPVYEGDPVTVSATAAGDGSLGLELRSSAGEVCATGSAALRAAPGEAPAVDRWPAVEQRTDPPPASPETLVAGTALGLAGHGFWADRAGDYLDEVREDLPLYREARVAHPGWLLRDANYVLSANVRLGPWIHVGSSVQHHALVRDGQRVSARAVVVREWERKGHRFVELDVALFAAEAVAAVVTHTAIHTPRRL